jgi:hypothetical protein
MARRCSTICLPFDQATYPELAADPAAFRAALGRLFLAAPELFPDGFAQGYRLKESRTSRKLGLRLRRVRLKATGATFTVRPSFALPYMAGWAQDASGPPPRARPAVVQAAAAAAAGVGGGEREGGVGAGAGAEAVRAGAGVRRGVRPPGRAPDQ